METLVIDRSRWACGGKGGESQLLNPLGNMCCLGFLGLQAGYTARELDDELTPADLIAKTTDGGTWPPGVIHDKVSDSPWTRVAMLINDNSHITDSERIMILQDHFQSIGIDLKFIGDFAERNEGEEG